jgi:hypothetical protein
MPLRGAGILWIPCIKGNGSGNANGSGCLVGSREEGQATQVAGDRDRLFPKIAAYE